MPRLDTSLKITVPRGRAPESTSDVGRRSRDFKSPKRHLPPHQDDYGKRVKDAGDKATDFKHPNPYVDSNPIKREDYLPRYLRVVGQRPFRDPPPKDLDRYTYDYEDAVKSRRDPWIVYKDGHEYNLTILADDWWCPREYAKDGSGVKSRDERRFLLDRALTDCRRLERNPTTLITPPTWLEAIHYSHSAQIARGDTTDSFEDRVEKMQQQASARLLSEAYFANDEEKESGDFRIIELDPSKPFKIRLKAGAEEPIANKVPPPPPRPERGRRTVCIKADFYDDKETAASTEATGFGFTQRWPDCTTNWARAGASYGNLFLHSGPKSEIPLWTDEFSAAAKLAGEAKATLAQQVRQAMKFPIELSKLTNRDRINTDVWPLPSALLAPLFREAPPCFASTDIRLRTSTGEKLDNDPDVQSRIVTFLVVAQYWARASHKDTAAFDRSNNLASAITEFSDLLGTQGVLFWHWKWQDKPIRDYVVQRAREFPIPLVRPGTQSISPLAKAQSQGAGDAPLEEKAESPNEATKSMDKAESPAKGPVEELPKGVPPVHEMVDQRRAPTPIVREGTEDPDHETELLGEVEGEEDPGNVVDYDDDVLDD